MAKKQKKRKCRAKKIRIIIVMILMEILLTFFCGCGIYVSRPLTSENTTEIVAIVESVYSDPGFGRRNYSKIEFHTNLGVFYKSIKTPLLQGDSIVSSIKEGDEIILMVRERRGFLDYFSGNEVFAVKSGATVYYSFDDAIAHLNFWRPFEVTAFIIFWLVGTFIIFCYGGAKGLFE